MSCRHRSRLVVARFIIRDHERTSPLAYLSASGLRPMFSSRCSRSAHVLLHSASGPRICSSTASCSSRTTAGLAAPRCCSVARRCCRRSTLSAPQKGPRAAGGALRAEGRPPLKTPRFSSLSVVARSWPEVFLDQTGDRTGCALVILRHRSTPSGAPAAAAVIMRSFPSNPQVTLATSWMTPSAPGWKRHSQRAVATQLPLRQSPRWPHGSPRA